MLQQYGKEETRGLYGHYKKILPDEVTEGASHRMETYEKSHLKDQRYAQLTNLYSGLLREDNSSLLAIQDLGEILLTISPSTAECERSFSGLNLIVSNLRTSLTEDSKD